MAPHEVLTQLKKYYRCKIHPSDRRAIVVYGISLKQLQDLCERYKCSGSYNEEESFGMMLNFGLYN